MPGRSFAGVSNENVMGLCGAEERRARQQDKGVELACGVPRQPGKQAYSLLQIGHLLHSFHSPWQRFKFKEEILGLPDADGFLLRSQIKQVTSRSPLTHHPPLGNVPSWAELLLGGKGVQGALHSP